MARHGENIRKRTDGRWEGRYRVFSGEKGGSIYISVYGHTYDEVKKKLSARKNSSHNVSMAKQKNSRTECPLFFSQIADEWLNEIKNNRKYSTYVKYDTIYQKYLAHTLGPCRIAEIGGKQIPSEIYGRLSESLKKSIFCVANQILEYTGLHYSEYIPQLKRPEYEVRRKPVEILSKKDQTKLFCCLYQETNRYKACVILCLHTGLRLGELCALKWSDIDFKNMIISVNRTVQRIGVKGRESRTVLMETEPKSNNSKREIPVTCTLLKLLENNCSNQPYVFGGVKPLEPRTMQYHFKKILKEAGIKDKNFHILRHTFATSCVEGGVDVKSLSEILGHSDVKITLNRYVHPTMDAKRKQMDRLIQYYGHFYGQAFQTGAIIRHFGGYL